MPTAPEQCKAALLRGETVYGVWYNPDATFRFPHYDVMKFTPDGKVWRQGMSDDYTYNGIWDVRQLSDIQKANFGRITLLVTEAEVAAQLLLTTLSNRVACIGGWED